MIAVMDTDGLLCMIKGYYRVTQNESTSSLGENLGAGNINSNNNEVEVDSEPKIKPDVMPPQKVRK